MASQKQNPPDFSGLLTGEAGSPPPPQPSRRIYAYPLKFTGTGGEYFRIWIVNTLLILCTLGLYYPWAKVRKLRYFYSCTWLDGHALDFHGHPAKMLKGSLIALAVLGVYSLTNKMAATEDAAGSPLLLAGVALLVVLLPFFLRTAMRFRLSNTSWRGLRLRFTGTTRDAYFSTAPALLAILLPATLESKPHALALLLVTLLAPYLLWSFKRYQHSHFAYGQENSEFRATVGDFYRLGFKLLGLGMVLGVLAGLAAGVAAATASNAAVGSRAFSVLMLTPLAILGFVFVKSWLQVRLFNLQWSRTGNAHVRLKATLSVRKYAVLQLKNYVLLVLTLGLYWPFAVVATRRMIITSVELRTRIMLETLAGSSLEGTDNATGDAAIDFFDMDFGI